MLTGRAATYAIGIGVIALVLVVAAIAAGAAHG